MAEILKLNNRDIKIESFDDASFYVDHLFRECFNGQPPPTYPINYVAFCKLTPSTFKVIGYINMIDRGEYGLVGGVCVDVDYRRKGLGEALLMAVEKDAKEAGVKNSLWGYTVNPALYSRVGYGPAITQYLMMKWLKPVSQEEEKRITDEVTKLCPF